MENRVYVIKKGKKRSKENSYGTDRRRVGGERCR